tara:strand:+ start:106 stop:558 length:453 start_codon:yes stop_codon:yes gene_type:complete
MIDENGNLYERIKRVYVHEDYRLFLFTGQKLFEQQPPIYTDSKIPEYDVITPNYTKNPEFKFNGIITNRRAMVLAVPFNMLSTRDQCKCLEISEPFNAESSLNITHVKHNNRLLVNDTLTGTKSWISANTLDRSVQFKISRPAAPRMLIV